MSEYKYNPQYNKNAIKYRKENLETFRFDLPKGEKALWKAYAESHNTTLTALIKDYMRSLIESEGFKMPEDKNLECSDNVKEK